VAHSSTILRRYCEKTPRSAERYRASSAVFPSGVTHDGRFLSPHPLFIDRAAGSRKWDIDGHEYIDYFGGHGSLLLGHSHPAVVEAVVRQAPRGTHYGAAHELELEWGALVCRMVPCAERVRFTASGTEATLLALRLARVFTGKPRFVRFSAHFHGWHDYVVFGGAMSTGEMPIGISDSVVSSAVVCPPNDVDALRRALDSSDDIGAVILEPTGASFGHVPLSAEFLSRVRALTRERGLVLIFDEVITGFRCAPGGAQEHFGVTPDLAVLAKVLAGGFPGGALAGGAGLFECMQYQVRDGRVVSPSVGHQGTFNANPISAAAGIATLNMVRSGGAIDAANRAATALRDGMNARLRERGSSWCVYGDFSGFHLFTNPEREDIGPDHIQSGRVPWRKLKTATPAARMHKIRAAFICGGVDVCSWPGGWVSAAHSPNDIDQTLSAFDGALEMLSAEGELN
jgi:glutamate-1-semialdehyde 2,1-aminomutase